jgi:excisionase family DNA binding protein
MQQDYLTPEEAAERKGVSRQSVYTAIRRGKLPSVRMLGRLAVRREDVDAMEFAPPNGQRRGMKLGPRKQKGDDTE